MSPDKPVDEFPMRECALDDQGRCIALVTENFELTAEVEEYRATFELRWAADIRAVKRWQEAHPERHDIWPDHADMVVWMLEQWEQLQAENTRLKKLLDAANLGWA